MSYDDSLSQAIKSVESGDRSLRQAPQKLILSDEMLKKPSLLLQIKYKKFATSADLGG
jgi:hypothetical protein